MIDLMTEDPITLREAQKHRLLCKSGRKGGPPNYSTMWHWCKTGINGVKLEHMYAGGTIVTTEEAIIRFMERLSGPSSGDSTGRARAAKKAHAEAARTLDRLGV